MTRHLRLLPAPARCEHTVTRGLVWRCRLLVHGPDQAHVLRAGR